MDIVDASNDMIYMTRCKHTTGKRKGIVTSFPHVFKPDDDPHRDKDVTRLRFTVGLRTLGG
jgi:hypothetical protein